MNGERKPRREMKVEDLPPAHEELAPEQAEDIRGGIIEVPTRQTRQISIVQDL
jgi:hypothetical protein